MSDALTLRWPDADFPEDLYTTLCGPGGYFEMEDADVVGVRMPVFKQRQRNLVELLVQSAERFPDREYVIDTNRSVTFPQMLDAATAVAQSLAREFGVTKGDRVAISAANCVDYTITFWATTMLGAITVAMNGWWTGPEMLYALELTEPKVLFGDRRRMERLDSAALPELPRVLFEDDFARLEAAGQGAARPDVEIAEDDPYLILFTSGTTGRPKGALLSHRSNIHFLWAQALRAAEGMLRTEQPERPGSIGGPAEPLGARAQASGGAVVPPPPPCIVSASPLFHVSGLNCQLVMSPYSGMTIIYAPPGKWDEETHLQMSARHGATVWSLVPTQVWRLLDWPTLGDHDLSRLQTIGGGSSVWPPELLRKIGEKLPKVRTGIGLGYGMTESNGLGTSLRGRATFERPDSVGQAVPTLEVQIREPGTDTVLGEDEVGEICMRSAANFLRYWNNPEATAAALDADRWYRTGDHGRIHDGYLYLEGRRSDLIIRGGENIYPAEIEVRLIEHPDITEVAVVGVEHAVLGQEVKAYVVTREPGLLTVEAVRAFAGETLASYKVPAYVEFAGELPHNASGKVLKHLLGKDAASDFVEE